MGPWPQGTHISQAGKTAVTSASMQRKGKRGAFLQTGCKPWDEQAIETVICLCFGGVLKNHRNKVKTFQLHQRLDCARETCPDTHPGERNYEDALSQPVAELYLGSGLQQDLRGGKLTPWQQTLFRAKDLEDNTNVFKCFPVFAWPDPDSKPNVRGASMRPGVGKKTQKLYFWQN